MSHLGSISNLWSRKVRLKGLTKRKMHLKHVTSIRSSCDSQGTNMAWSINKAVLVPYDFSTHSRVAVDKALSIADSPSQVHILHVLPTFIPLAPEGFPVEAIDDQVRLEYTQKALDEEFADPRYSQCSKEVLIGDPGSTCVDRAKTIGADLIVIPSHGRSGISRLVLGSVAERVVRFSHVPVLVLKITD